MSVPMSATKTSLICILLALSLFVDILDAYIKLQPPRPTGLPAGQPQQPVVKNFYGSPQHSKGGGGGGGGVLEKIAVAGIVGSALYDALKPRNEYKTIVNYHHTAAPPAATPAASLVPVAVKPNQTMMHQLMPGQVSYQPRQVYYKPIQVPYQPYFSQFIYKTIKVAMVIVPLKPGDKTNAKLQAYGAVLTYIGVLFCIGVMVGFLKKLYFTKM